MAAKAKRVREIIKDCLFTNEEIHDDPHRDAVLVKGVASNFGFHPGRLGANKQAIRELLLQIPEAFFVVSEGGGGGWSFMNLCIDRDGNHWAEHRTMDELVCLGIGAGMAKFCIEDREVWKALPGGVPYVAFFTEAEAN